MIVFTVNCELFKVEPLFILDCSYEHLQAYLLRRFNIRIADEEGVNGGKLAGTCWTFDVEPWRLVWASGRSPAVVIHECFHLVTRLCYDRGIVIRAKNERGETDDETAAYLMEFFTSAALKRLVRRR